MRSCDEHNSTDCPMDCTGTWNADPNPSGLTIFVAFAMVMDSLVWTAPACQMGRRSWTTAMFVTVTLQTIVRWIAQASIEHWETQHG